jgi:hypothetical protein
MLKKPKTDQDKLFVILNNGFEDEEDDEEDEEDNN